MNTVELTKHVSKKLGITRAVSKQAVNEIFAKVLAEVKKGKNVRLNGFGVFYKANRKERKGRNPQTGETVTIPALNVPRFRAGKKFRECVK